MWIKTQKGDYCNLDRATDIAVTRIADGDSHHTVRVYFHDADDFTVIFSGTKDQCRDVIDEIAMFLTITYINSLNKHKPE